jgi:hypothetical protein
MKRLLFILFVGFCGSTFSQPLLDSLFIPTVGTTLTFKTCDTTGINPSPAGPNQIFDYHTLIATGTSYTSYVDPVGTLGYSTFPDASLALNFGSFTKYYRTTLDSFLYIGGYNNSSGGSVNDNWDYGLNLQLPSMQYDSLYIDTAYMAYYTPSAANRIVIKKWKFDAYGQLLLPTNTYDTVYRVWTETEFHSASNFSFIAEHYIEYIFIPSNLRHSVFSIFYGQSGSADYKTVKYTESITGIEDIYQDNDLRAFPNPFTDNIFLTNLKRARIRSIRLINLLGREVYYENFTSNPESLDLPNFLVAGIYILNIETDKGVARLKLVKQ